ncbi:alpha-tocopherol transfer protein-like [Helicoverpa armigera]|uniref:alpha-tocopherol transfer protein-like n=1 Tax=Helicoverpa armigera TaxID=29058 RepID=UPI003082BEDA
MKLEDTPLLKFRSDTVVEVRKELNLDQDAIDKMLQTFEDWIAKQNHFTRKEFDRHFLETSIVHAKGSLEKAKRTLDKLCTLKTLLPTYFSKCDVKNEFTDISVCFVHGTMPDLTKSNYRVYIAKIVSTNIDSELLLDYSRFVVLMSEYAKIYDYSFGYTCVVDCRDVNILGFVTKVNVIDLRNALSVMMEGYGLRINAIYVVSTSKAIDAFVTLLKQVVSHKVSDRIYVLKTVEAIHEHVPKEVLPKDYGGDQMTLKETNENWNRVLSEKENVSYFRSMFAARTNENYRLTAAYNDEVLGMPGSFRTLNVD